MKNLDALEGRSVDIAPLLYMAGIGDTPTTIVETDGMYPYKTDIEDNWAYYTAVGMKHFRTMLEQEGRQPERISIVGICSGVEAIAIARIFDQDVKELIVTDIDEGILEGTIYNLHHTITNKDLTITPVVGSFCEPIEKTGKKVEFVHGNIPNLPATGEEDLTKGAEKGTFLMVGTYEGYHPPEEFLGWALGAQYAFLQSAKNILVEGGSIITELGGRMPLEEVRKLFAACGYRMEEVVVGFKEQTEALIDFEGYHRLEEAYGTSFDFYRYTESKEALHQAGIENPSFQVSGEEVKKLLTPFKVSAGEAAELYHQGIPVGHTVHLFRGIL
ncbi:MAG: hypothetical protein WDN10_05075 [bacterium]